MARTASKTGTLDFTTLSPATRRYEWFTMDQDDDDPGEPFRIKAQRLTPAEVEAIPADNSPIKDVLRDCRHYITGWNLQAVTGAGDVIAVMPPAEMDEAGLDIAFDRLVTQDQRSWMYQVLKFGHLVKVISEKKASIRSGTTPASSPEDS
jgi:hypothetical protein